MTRDYAGKGKPKPRTTRGKTKVPAKKPFPWHIALAAVAAVCLLGYVLLTINGAADKAAKPAEPEASTPQQSKKQKPAEALPEKPTERWDYIEALPKAEVEVEVPEQQSSGPYQMQCGSFRKEGQAETMRAKIAFQGIESMVRRTEGSNGAWYRVVLGPYERKRAAEKDRHAIQKVGINTCQIWRWR